MPLTGAAQNAVGVHYEAGACLLCRASRPCRAVSRPRIRKEEGWRAGVRTSWVCVWDADLAGVRRRDGGWGSGGGGGALGGAWPLNR